MDIKRAQAAISLPSPLNRRTATSLVGPHSKASLSASRREALADLDVMHDGIVRLRTPEGLRMRHREQELDCAAIARLLGEVVITQHARADGTMLTGQLPKAILLVENLGAYMDVPAPAGWLLAHVPGWDTCTVRLLLQQLRNVPVAHFGDLDPNGVRIMRHPREVRPDLRWVVPSFWAEYVPKVGLRAGWPPAFDLTDVPPLVVELASSAMWLEQEAIVVDRRLPWAIESAIVEGT